MVVAQSPSDNQLIKMADDAYKEIESDIPRQKIMEDRILAVMVALSVDNQVFFASSMKGSNYVYKKIDGDGKLTPNIEGVPGAEQLQKALEDCMKQDADKQHKNNAMCGEIMATYTWLLNHKGQDLKNKSPKPRIVAWNGKIKKVIDPCSTSKSTDSE